MLHRDEIAGETTYEIAHEYLIEEIQTWINQADLAFKQAEELLVREVASWRAHGTLIPGDRLEKLESVLDDVLYAGAIEDAELRAGDAAELSVDFEVPGT